MVVLLLVVVSTPSNDFIKSIVDSFGCCFLLAGFAGGANL